MAVEMKPEWNAVIDEAYVVWFTTVRADGMPQPTPVWFIKDGDTFLIYSVPDNQKLRNIQQNSKVALAFANDPEAEKYVVVMGDAAVDLSVPPVQDNPAYVAKYADGIKGLGWKPEDMGKRFTAPIRITPTQIRGE